VHQHHPRQRLKHNRSPDPVEDNSPYQMSEDLKAFNEYWVQAEHGLGRQLSYEEVIVLFNQDRQASKTLSDYED